MVIKYTNKINSYLFSKIGTLQEITNTITDELLKNHIVGMIIPHKNTSDFSICFTLNNFINNSDVFCYELNSMIIDLKEI